MQQSLENETLQGAFQGSVKIKINFKFYFHTSLWCLKRLYEDL